MYERMFKARLSLAGFNNSGAVCFMPGVDYRRQCTCLNSAPTAVYCSRYCSPWASAKERGQARVPPTPYSMTSQHFSFLCLRRFANFVECVKKFTELFAFVVCVPKWNDFYFCSHSWPLPGKFCGDAPAALLIDELVACNRKHGTDCVFNAGVSPQRAFVLEHMSKQMQHWMQFNECQD